ncbi:hypothetical protein [Chachezhania sediminis]|uniref:hypothetical protein n=1 Tax=Chachezhania sediminis TaxID=2599291 RepID=UPI00131C0B1E|nr:hypothetical protein [Chachezhania sediminis]
MTRYLVQMVLAEAMAIALIALIYAALVRGILAYPAWILAAGALQGLLLGTVQRHRLRRLGYPARAWTPVTVLAATASYGLSILAGMGTAADPTVAVDPMVRPDIAMLAGMGAAMGAGLGLLMGLVQLVALPFTMSRASWALANLSGWAPAAAVLAVAAAIPGADWPLWHVGLLGAGAGAVAGLFVACLTSPVFRPALDFQARARR